MAFEPSPALLTVHLPQPSIGAEVLNTMFPEKFCVEEVEGSNSKILCDKDQALIIILVESQNTAGKSVVWVATDDDFNRVAEAQRRDIDGFTFVEIILQDAISILMVTPRMVATGRNTLGKLLSRRHTIGVVVGGNDIDVILGPTAPSECDLPKFPSLQAKILDQNNKKRRFPLNSRNAVDVETELFKGKILLTIRPENAEDDPYWNERIFSKKKRRIVLQLQGKFKYKPEGVVYAGGEVSQAMKLGLVTRGLCTILLKLIESMNSSVHYSFGDSKGIEQAHIVVPAYTFFDSLIATPPGEIPPAMGEPFKESKESFDRRRASKSTGDWNTSDTYSFSFHSMYLDLPTWRCIDLRVVPDIDLKSFWGDSLLRLCMYEKKSPGKIHEQKSNRYAFALDINYIGKDGPENDELSEEHEDVLKLNEKQISRVVEERPENATGLKRVDSQLFPVSKLSWDFDSSDDVFFDTEEGSILTTKIEAKPTQQMEVGFLPTIDAFCPAWIEMYNCRGRYTKAYAINVGSRTIFRSSRDCDNLDGNSAVEFVSSHFSSRMSSSERMRRVLGVLLSRVDNENPPRNITSLLRAKSEFDSSFLRRSGPSLSVNDKAKVHISGCVARAISDRHWIEEWAKLTDRSISFYRPGKEKTKPNFRVMLSSIAKVERIASEQSPLLHGYHFLFVETLGRTVYLMFPSESERDKWLHMINSTKIARRPDDSESVTGSNYSFNMFEMDNPMEEFMHESSLWNCRKRRILNCGQFLLRSQAINESPLELVEKALLLALQASKELMSENPELRRAFLNATAALKKANVQTLQEEARLTFFLNLYHVMILHAFLVLGLPDSGLQWVTYFNTNAYEVGDDIFSIAELEHCIIRARMTYPAKFLSRFVVPKSYYRMALTKPDYRINFALNCGSISNPPTIFVFREGELDQQLDAACRLYLKSVSLTQRSSREMLISIPRVCEWFAEDFGSSRKYLLRRIKPYLNEEIQRALDSLWNPEDLSLDMDTLKIRYRSYSFKCRFPKPVLSNGNGKQA